MYSPIFNVHDVILFVTLALCVLLAFFQFFLPSKNTLSRYLLTFFLLDMAMGVIGVLVFWNPYINIQPFFDQYLIPYFLFGSLLLKGPLLYCYVLSITTTSYRFTYGDLTHLLPLLVYFLLMAIFQIDTDKMKIHEHNVSPFAHLLGRNQWHIVKFIPVIYASLAVYKVYRYRKQLKNQYSNLFSQGPAWLSVLTLGVLFNWGWALVVHICGQYYPIDFVEKFGVADNYLALVLVVALCTYSLAYANKLYTASFDSVVHVYSNESEKTTIDKIIAGMDEKKLYLDSRLNIEIFSDAISVPYREVSAVINRHFGTNFFEFINAYRINEAKRMLANAQYNELPVYEVFTQAGFHSKSAFHRCFSEMVQMSPTEFRKQAQKTI